MGVGSTVLPLQSVQGLFSREKVGGAVALTRMCGAIPLFSLTGPSATFTVTFTYLLTPWSRALLEKLTVNFAASQEIPRIYGTLKFLTVPTSARHLSLRLRDTSSRNTLPPPPRRSEWGSSLPPECFVSRGSISHG
jgi:hypothetical protein